ncbi:hypothetical protein ILUMI_06509 [Ignelater luminosus]|uniref:Uncharacterized protein n=1 Tax=Ignelater luminosus TaxID=2038154 RepID=A0A8K0D937_IGNLU|nr:hypothetical protein ILUMI_06509 [Ignelater luminosus]
MTDSKVSKSYTYQSGMGREIYLQECLKDRLAVVNNIQLSKRIEIVLARYGTSSLRPCVSASPPCIKQFIVDGRSAPLVQGVVHFVECQTPDTENNVKHASLRCGEETNRDSCIGGRREVTAESQRGLAWPTLQCLECFKDLERLEAGARATTLVVLNNGNLTAKRYTVNIVEYHAMPFGLYIEQNVLFIHDNA